MKTAPQKFSLVRRRGAVRFKGNSVVRWLYDQAAAGIKADLNDIWRHGFPVADMQEFYRLLEYSVSGYGDIFPHAKSTREADAQVAATYAARRKRRRR